MQYELPYPTVKTIQLSYSGGKASQLLVEMLLRGDLKSPVPIVITNADPGMEDIRTYLIVADTERRCKEAKIPFLRAYVNLYEGLLNAKRSGASRFDFPAFYTKNRVTGKIGMMTQRCTKWCKIAPMDRLARRWLHSKFGISAESRRIGNKILCKWIGFSLDETTRIKDHPIPKYVCFDYPLAAMGFTDEKILAKYAEYKMTPPPRSVCAGCFANDETYFKEMWEHRPQNWDQAVRIDEEIRDLSQFGMHDECYVYAGCIPLTELARLGFPKITKQTHKCHTGHCFI